MSKKKISCFITVDSNDLEELCKGKSVKNYKFVDKTIFRHGDGFVTNVVIFSLNGEYFKFLEIQYVEITYTIPHQVFLTEETYTRSFYSSWVDEDQ